MSHFSVTSLAAFTVLAFTPATSQAITVLLSGTSNAPLEAFLNAKFSNITTLKSGDYSNFANDAVLKADVDSADVVIIGRILSSAGYGDAVKAAAFNAITVPVVSFTSYVTRPDGNRLGWEGGPVIGTNPVTDAESSLTLLGATVFGGVQGAVDWYDGTANFNAAGTGSLGGGELLASIGGSTLAAHWSTGSLSAGGVVFPADRFLFNLQDASGLVLPNAAGQDALVRALTTYTRLIAVPEPSTASMSGLAALGLLAANRRRNR